MEGKYLDILALTAPSSGEVLLSSLTRIDVISLVKHIIASHFIRISKNLSFFFFAMRSLIDFC